MWASWAFLRDLSTNTSNTRLEVIADELTHKDGDLWIIHLSCQDCPGHYYLDIYLPWNVELKDIDTIKGLTHFVTTFNGTLVADIQGYNIKNPEVTLGYKLCPVPYQPAVSPLDQGLQACTPPMDYLPPAPLPPT
jgi:hypothetical protein